MKVSFNYFLLIFFFVYCFGLVLFFMFFIFGRRVLKCEMFKEGFIFGLIFFFGYGFQIVGFKYMMVLNLVFIIFFYVVLILFIVYFMFGEKVIGRDLILLVLVVIGFYLIFGVGMFINYGDFFILFCVVSFVFQIVFVYKFGEKDYLSLIFWQLFWNFIFLVFFVLVFEEFVFLREVFLWVGVIYMVVFVMVIVFMVQFKYQRYMMVQRVVFIYFFELVFGLFVVYIVLGEMFFFRGYLGVVLIMSGILNEVRKN